MPQNLQSDHTSELIKSSTAVILAGGQARRMHFQMKSALPWKDKTFLTAIYDQLELFSKCLISVDRKERFHVSLDMIEDQYPGYGPLGAIYSCLSQADTPLVFFTACDTPLLTKQLVYFLYRHLLPTDEACIAKTGDGRLHPLCGIYRKELAPHIRKSLDSGDCRVMHFLDSRATRRVTIPQKMEQQLTNVNTMETYRELCSLYNK